MKKMMFRFWREEELSLIPWQLNKQYQAQQAFLIFRGELVEDSSVRNGAWILYQFLDLYLVHSFNDARPGSIDEPLWKQVPLTRGILGLCGTTPSKCEVTSSPPRSQARHRRGMDVFGACSGRNIDMFAIAKISNRVVRTSDSQPESGGACLLRGIQGESGSLLISPNGRSHQIPGDKLLDRDASCTTDVQSDFF